MRITDIFTEQQIVPCLKAEDKIGVLHELADHICHLADFCNLSPEVVAQALVDRENLGSTGVGEGVAIPHARIPGLNRLCACLGRSLKGITFDALDGRPVHLLVVLLVPEGSTGLHLKALACCAGLLSDQLVRQELMSLTEGPALFGALKKRDRNL